MVGSADKAARECQRLARSDAEVLYLAAFGHPSQVAVEDWAEVRESLVGALTDEAARLCLSMGLDEAAADEIVAEASWAFRNRLADIQSSVGLAGEA